MYRALKLRFAIVVLTATCATAVCGVARHVSAQVAPPESWPLPRGGEASGSIFVTADKVHVLDWQKQAQFEIDRKGLPRPHAEFAKTFYDEIQAMIKPFETKGKVAGTDFVEGTFKGKLPYDVADTSTCTMLVDGYERVQYMSKRKKLCKVENANTDHKKDGPQLKLYPTGEVCQIYFFNAGVMEGAYLHLYRNGRFLSASIKKGGKSTGTDLLFHENGNLAMATPTVDGVRHGEVKHFDLEGKLYGTQDFLQGRAGSMDVVREIQTEAEFRAVTAATNRSTEVVCFGELWKND